MPVGMFLCETPCVAVCVLVIRVSRPFGSSNALFCASTCAHSLHAAETNKRQCGCETDALARGTRLYLFHLRCVHAPDFFHEGYVLLLWIELHVIGVHHLNNTFLNPWDGTVRSLFNSVLLKSTLKETT